MAPKEGGDVMTSNSITDNKENLYHNDDNNHGNDEKEVNGSKSNSNNDNNETDITNINPSKEGVGIIKHDDNTDSYGKDGTYNNGEWWGNKEQYLK